MMLAGVPLSMVVMNIRDRDCRKLFYVFCVNHPIHKHYSTINDEELLAAEYMFGGADAINMVIAHSNGGMLLTLPVSPLLREDILTVTSHDAKYKPISIPNLHGATDVNINAIERELLNRNYSALAGLDKIGSLAPNVVCSEPFKKRFEKFTSEDIKSIFDRLDEARANHMLQPLVCNGTIIKQVAPHVAELRIVNPVDIRVYFHEQGDTLYFAKAALKSEYVGRNDQNDDIMDSEKLIKEMLINVKSN